MAKITYVCDNCGWESKKWQGFCSSCKTMNAMKEFKHDEVNFSRHATLVPFKLSQIDKNKVIKIKTGNFEMDRVWGNGIALGSLNLIGGEPGIGKTSLVLKMCSLLSKKYKILYVSGEENIQQVAKKMIALNMNEDNITIYNETCVEEIIEIAKEFDFLIIDSVQTIYSKRAAGLAGGTAQLKETTLGLMQFGKITNTTIFLIGHVTKNGVLAGPKVLEHMVDTVTYFANDRMSDFRLLKTVKNRFGKTGEVGVFEMTDEGIKSVNNPSQSFIDEDLDSNSTIVPTIEGSRSFLCEIQSLTNQTLFGNPRRAMIGLSGERANIIQAVLEKRCKVVNQNKDVYVKVSSGLKIDDPACDFAIAMSLTASILDKQLDQRTCYIGEISLSGGIKKVSDLEKRIDEAHKHGIEKIYIPFNTKIKSEKKVKLIRVKNLKEAIDKIA